MPKKGHIDSRGRPNNRPVILIGPKRQEMPMKWRRDRGRDAQILLPIHFRLRTNLIVGPWDEDVL